MFSRISEVARIGNSFLVLLGCPFGRYDLGTTRRACEARALRARNTLTPRFTDFFSDFEKKARLFCSLERNLINIDPNFKGPTYFDFFFSFINVIFCFIVKYTVQSTN